MTWPTAGVTEWISGLLFCLFVSDHYYPMILMPIRGVRSAERYGFGFLNNSVYPGVLPDYSHFQHILGELSLSGIGLSIHPAGERGISYHLEGSDAALSCRVNASADAKISTLRWIWPDTSARAGEEIRARSDSRIHAFPHPGKKGREIILTFKSIQHADAGRYRCEASQESQTAETSIDIHVTRQPSWISPDRVVVSENGSVEVKCEASGDPEPDVQFIPPGDDEEFKSEDFVDRGDVLVILKANRHTTPKEIGCRAVQTVDTTSFVVLRKIAIDVQYLPEFASRSETVHAIIDRNVSLICQVSDANPPVSDFEFYRDNVRFRDLNFRDKERYTLRNELDQQKATLIIKNSNDDDFTRHEYRCVAANMVGSVQKDFTLIKIEPPGQLQAGFVRSTDSAVWFIFTDPEYTGGEGVEITSYKVEYQKKPPADEAKADDEQTADEEIEEEKGRENFNYVILPKEHADRHHYPVNGLEPSTQYNFRISAGNPAGYGEYIELTAKTSFTSAASSSSHFSSNFNYGRNRRHLLLVQHFLSILAPSLLTFLLVNILQQQSK